MSHTNNWAKNDPYVAEIAAKVDEILQPYDSVLGNVQGVKSLNLKMNCINTIYFWTMITPMIELGNGLKCIMTINKLLRKKGHNRLHGYNLFITSRNFLTFIYRGIQELKINARGITYKLFIIVCLINKRID